MAPDTKGVGVLVVRNWEQLHGFGAEKKSMLMCSPEQMEYSNENKNKNKRSVYLAEAFTHLCSFLFFLAYCSHDYYEWLPFFAAPSVC